MLIKLFKTNLVKATSIILVLVFMFSSIHPCIAQNPEDEAAYSGSLIQFEFNRAAAYPMDTTYEDTDNTWRFVANSSGWTPTDSKSYNTNPSNYDGMQLHFGDKNQRYWMVFELNIPYAGKYRVNMSHKANKNGASSYMFFFPETEDIESQLNEENRIGMVNYYSSEFQEKVDTELTDITVTSSGKYFIAIQYIASSSRLFMYPGVLTLDGTVLDNVCLLLEDDAIGPGETVTASMTAQLSSGEAVNLDSVEVLYSSSEPAIAAIDSDTGAITGISEGETEISVTVASDNISITESKTLRVAEDYSVKSIKLSYPDTMYVGNQYQLELSALLTNNELRSIPIQEAEVELISSEPENVVTINDNGLVSADNLGAAVISVKTTYRGKALESESVILRVTQLHSSEFSYLYNFWYQAYVGDISKNGREYTDYSKTRLWAYVEDTSTVSSSSGTAIDILTANMQIVLKKDEWFAFKINVPEEGKYNALFDYSAGKNRGIIDFYIAPLPEDISKETIESNINDKNKIASVDMYNSESIKASDELADINFEKPGEYLLILYSADKNASSSNYYMFPISLRFEGLNALKSIELSLDNSSNEIEIGNSTRLKYSGTLVDGTETALTDGNVKLVFTSFNPQIASVDKDGIISANGIGTAKINVIATMNNHQVESNIFVTVTDYSDVSLVELVGKDTIWIGGTLQLKQNAILSSGNKIPIASEFMTYSIVSCEPEGCATVSETGLLTGVSNGIITISGIADFRGDLWETQPLIIKVSKSSKTGSTIWTKEKREAIQENRSRYTWAKNQYNAILKAADKYVDNDELLWNIVPPEGLPRRSSIGSRLDPENGVCKYCGADINVKFGLYTWLKSVKPFSKPFKVRCQNCKRYFPSNDFAGFYNLGIDEHGVFNHALAHEKNDELISTGKPDFLNNALYPEKPDGWGVDDGFGYYPGETVDGVEARHNYIACYMNALWYINGGEAFITDAINKLSLAYVYSGDVKYGRTGAVLLDRVADFYPDYDWYRWHAWRGDSYRGKVTDPVFECYVSKDLANAYDALFPVFDDPRVISFLSNKSDKYKMENPKNSAEAIRSNIEDGILREIFKACQQGKIGGNFGMTQLSLITAAIALDTMPETQEWIDWLMLPGALNNTGNPEISPLRTGGNILPKFVDTVDRDGSGNEAAPGYNSIWVFEMLEVAELLNLYNSDVNLYDNPKYAKMFTSQIPITLVSHFTAQIGDSGGAGGTANVLARHINELMIGFKRLRNPTLAQLIYNLNGDTEKGLHLDITERDPEHIQEDILKIIEEFGEFMPKSEMMTGYGFAVLRDGVRYNSVGIDTSVNNLRDFWIYFGRGTGHGHADCLNLGIEAYGLNIAPDLGYPEQTGTQPNRVQWVSSTLSHNTVMVDGKKQLRMPIHGTPLHFDDSDSVKVMDIDAHGVYAETDIYRRTVVMVKVNDDVSYGVDFFRILGGDDHIYSFHSQSEIIHETEGLELIPQVDKNGVHIGTYASPDVPWGSDPETIPTSSETNYLRYPPGTTWLDYVRRDKAPDKKFAVDFKITDFKKILNGNPDLHLRMTMLNDYSLDEVAICHGTPPRTPNSISTLEYVLARRTGENLDTLFTTVFEPYKDSRYIKSMTSPDLEILSGVQGPNDTAQAVKIEHVNGRIDYIIYSTNNSVKYKVDNSFEFQGFVGVFSIKDGIHIIEYINDGTTLSDVSGKNAYTGTVIDFTRELTLDNNIKVNFNEEIDPEVLIEKYIYIENNRSPENGVYRILSAKKISNEEYEFDVGDVTLIRSYYDANDISQGFNYNIEAGQEFRIPLSNITKESINFENISEKTVDANSQIRFSVAAVSSLDRELEYSSVSLPRGASFDPNTRTFTWTPDSTQTGKHHVSIKADDGYISSVLHVVITVLSSTIINEKTSNSTPSGGQQSNNTSVPTQHQQPSPPQNQDKFTDIGNYGWAREAINKLADLGIILGTGVNTYSPGSNIRRADFVLLLVRAFSLNGTDDKGFSDVPQNAYYKEAIDIAKANGIIYGVKENLFNPESFIKREDVIAIIVRTLKSTGKTQLSDEQDMLSSFSDNADISDYARQSVNILANMGVIQGSNNKIDPGRYITRAEIAVLIKRVLDMLSDSTDIN